MTTPKVPLSRAPRGVLSEKPVCMRLLPEERQTLERMAREEKRSISSLARLVLLAGIPHYKAGRTRTP
ncbi:hypothetical protein PP727_20880 [Ralstonia solanacearum]|nr:hypothetical protein [Ralstonia solanacearum]MDC6212622.1 hypothetical protein [Ralstonia solanacearum]MDC6241987.1 hypothetical protein [Ralstonia solanacearum]MDD7802507.1 hypothetical protein [Ralstonia solanacearum]